MVPLIPVDSSNIEAVGYDPESQVMHVKFRSGDTYQYSGVPADEHQALMSAPSIGGHFHRRIKGRYGFSKA